MNNMNEQLHYLADIVRVGNVVSTNNGQKTVRVQFPDLDDVVSHDLRVIFRRTGTDKDSGGLPDIGEQVVCLFLPSGDETGFVIGSIYSQQNTPPSDSNQDRVIDWLTAQGVRLYIDRSDNTLVVEGIKKAVITATESVQVTAPLISLSGNVTIEGSLEVKGTVKGNINVDGNIHATGTILDEGGNSNHHKH